MDPHRLQYLWEQYMNKAASREELDELFTLLQSPELDVISRAFLDQYFRAGAEQSENAEIDRDYWVGKLAAVRAGAAPVRSIRFRPATRWAAAASVIALLGLGSYFIFFNKTPNRSITNTSGQPLKNDVPPGTNKAILTLGNGSKIILDSARNGLLANQTGSSIIKTDSGKLVYHPSNSINPKNEKQLLAVSLNTLTTPRGGEFQLTLPDGTKVWLNAASSITYPTAFTSAPGSPRKVSITGEAYFEVTHNEKHPFIVSANGTEVQDIGTHFNINAYPDENGIQTTLLEGSVKVSSEKNNQSAVQSVILIPGQQSQLKDNLLTINKNVNTNEIIAWKEGSFDFESADLKTILRQFARWYDIDVVYEGTITNKKFFAIVSRNTSLKKVLELLQDNNIKYEIEGKKLTIKSN